MKRSPITLPILAFTFFGIVALAQNPRSRSTPSIGEIRRQLDELERQRREAEETANVYDWTEIAPPPNLAHPQSRDTALVELVHTVDRMNCEWRFDPAEKDSDRQPVVALLDVKGSEWIRIPAGEWQLRLRVAEPGAEPLLFRPEAVRAQSGRAYRLTFGEHEASAAKSRIRQMESREREQQEIQGRER